MLTQAFTSVFYICIIHLWFMDLIDIHLLDILALPCWNMSENLCEFDIFILWLRRLGQHNCLVDWKVWRIGRFLGKQSHSSTCTHVVCALPREPDGDAPGTTANKSTWSETWRLIKVGICCCFIFVCESHNLGGGFKHFLFSPRLGKISNLTHIFQMGWNHQLAIYSQKLNISMHP